MPQRAIIDTANVDPELVPGAHNAVRTCLAVTPKDNVVLIADTATLDIAAALLRELDEVGAPVTCFVLEEHGSRPLSTVPTAIVKAFEKATVSLMMVRPEPGELKARRAVLDLAQANGARHAHMPGVDRRMMVTGMRADYRRVARLQDRLLARLKPESVVRVKTEAGTDLEVRFSPDHKWVRCDGLISAGYFQNLPTGQLYTTPLTVEGTFVADAAIGEWFSMKYPDLASYPLTLDIAQGRVRDAHSSNSVLARQLLVYMRSNENGDRIGEYSFGTNLALSEYLGNALQDENVPGAHITLGGAAILGTTGAKWTATTHVPVIARRCDVSIDGAPVMEHGVYVPEILPD